MSQDANCHARIEQLQSLAERWEQWAKGEDGKTAQGGWASREIWAAEQRARHCRDKRDACLEEIKRLQISDYYTDRANGHHAAKAP